MAKKKSKKAANTAAQPSKKAKKAAVQPSEATKKLAKNLNPIDDLFFNKMAEDAATCEEVISTILEMKVKVLSVIPQNTIASLQGRGVRLDALAEVVPDVQVQIELLENGPIGERGAKVNVEVQKSNRDDYQRRSRYNASAITVNTTIRGLQELKNIPDVVEIFICGFDVFKEGELKYIVDRVLRKSGRVVNNGVMEIYVSAILEDRSTPTLSAISDLMKIFMESSAYDYEQFPKFSERKHQFKETEEGIRIMSEELQELIDEETQKAAQEIEQKVRQEAAQETERQVTQVRQEAERQVTQVRQETEQKATQNALLLSIQNVMEALQLTADKAMDILKIPPSERSMYADKL